MIEGHKLKEGSFCSALVLINRKSSLYNRYEMFIRPYLEHFGVPYTEWDITQGGIQELGHYHLIIAGHRELFRGETSQALVSKLSDAVENGAGLVSFEEPLPFAAGWNGGTPVRISASPSENAEIGSFVVDNSHYISSLHEQNEMISLYKPVSSVESALIPGGQVLVRSGDHIVLQAGNHGKGRIALWNDCRWMSHEVKGPVHGMDDLVWRSLVWAAKKPFVMQGLPPFVTMRVDDVWGSLRSGKADNPLYWVDVCNQYGIKPWLGVFLDNVTETVAQALKQYTDSGQATVFPHAFAGNVNSVDPNKPEHWIYFDHHNKCNYSEPELQQNLRRVEGWHKETGIPISSVAISHYYEMGSNAVQTLVDWGCETIGIHMNPGEPFVRNADWVAGGPFRLFEKGERWGTRPVYYADYLRIPDQPELDGKLFNCVIEIRDNTGYEWAPDNHVEKTVANGILQLRRSFDSMALASLFTHESDFIQHITPENWESIIRAICEGISGYQPIYITTDDACRYIRAKYHLNIEEAVYENGRLSLCLAGSPDVPTRCYLFNEGDDGKILSELLDLPAFNGRKEVRFEGV